MSYTFLSPENCLTSDNRAIESRFFEKFPSLLRLHYPEEAYFFAALSLDRTSKSARDILNNILKRTALCKPDSLFQDEWLLVRHFVASIEGGNVKDTTYLTDILSVQKRLGELTTQTHPFRPIQELSGISCSSLRTFLMAQHSHSRLENTGEYISEEEAREYARREMEFYIPQVRKMIDFK